MDTLESVGLNKYLLEMANIRNQDSWVHSDDPQEATSKAKDLVQMAVVAAVFAYNTAMLDEPLPRKPWD